MKKINSKKKEKKKTKKSEEKKIAGSEHFSDKKRKEEKLEEEVKQAEKAITHRLREALNDKEEIEQDFFEEPIIQIPISTETKAPVLERIIQRQMPIENPIEIEQSRETREERRIDYSPVSNEPNYGFERNTKEDEEKKYESTFVPPVLTRTEISGKEMRQEFLRPQNEAWGNKINENWQSIDTDIVEEETKLPFEEQKKYKRFKLR